MGNATSTTNGLSVLKADGGFTPPIVLTFLSMSHGNHKHHFHTTGGVKPAPDVNEFRCCECFLRLKIVGRLNPCTGAVHHMHKDKESREEKNSVFLKCCVCQSKVQIDMAQPAIDSTTVAQLRKETHKEVDARFLAIDTIRKFGLNALEGNTRSVKAGEKFQRRVGYLASSHSIFLQMGYKVGKAEDGVDVYLPPDSNSPDLENAVSQLVFEQELNGRLSENVEDTSDGTDLITSLLDAKYNALPKTNTPMAVRMAAANLLCAADMPDEMIAAACECCIVDEPAKTSTYLSALKELAEARSSSVLHQHYTRLLKKAETTLNKKQKALEAEQLKSAFSILGIPENANDDLVISSYKECVAERPARTKEFREAFRVIAMVRVSSKLMDFYDMVACTDGVTTTGYTPDYEKDLIEKAMQESLKTYTSAPSKPERSLDMPMGLQNIASNCYFNSLIQVLFHIPKFRRVVLEYRQEEGTDIPAAQFMAELQRLFVVLGAGTDQTCSAEAALQALRKSSGSLHARGSQQDISEYMDVMLTQIDKALESKCGGASQDVSAMDELFAVKTKSTLEYESAGERLVKETHGVMSLLVVDLRGELYGSLEEALEYDVEYNVAKEGGPPLHVNAHKRDFFTALPPILTILFKRVDYNSHSRTTVKLNSVLTFENIIYMDRFLEQNAAAAQQCRAGLVELKQEEKAVLARIEKYAGATDGVTLVDAVGKTLSALRSMDGDDVLGAPPPAVVDGLADLHHRMQDVLAGLEEELKGVRAKMQAVWSGMQDHPYRIHAIFVHGGGSTAGHYWAYIHDKKRKRWIEANDSRVSIVDQEEVWSNAHGKAATSAYCVVYVDARAEAADLPTDESVLQEVKRLAPAHLMQDQAVDMDLL